MLRKIIVLATLAMLCGCSGAGRYAGLNNCSADGSVVLREYPNSTGSYAGLNNGPCKTAM
ncbi:MAG TPA: hypothetical protein VL993_15445 [Stellaceae bacterium]|nr:hypothetical protein [Stellaceae bacterium]